MLVPFLDLPILHHFLAGEFGRLTATLVAGVGCVAAYHLWQRYLSQRMKGRASEDIRERMVWSKNTFWAIGTVAVLTIWATKIAGLALTLTALAGATLLVSKELVMCFLGYGVVVVTRPYRLGDYVELGGHAGKVIDISIFSTTLAETGSLHQLTGKTLAVPNSIAITSPVRNASATGAFMVDLYRITLPISSDVELASTCALAAALAATEQWLEPANLHLKHIESQDFIDLPSSKPKVFWESPDGRGLVMTVRFACPIEERVATEQEVFRKFWASYAASSKVGVSSTRDD